VYGPERLAGLDKDATEVVVDARGLEKSEGGVVATRGKNHVEA